MYFEFKTWLEEPSLCKVNILKGICMLILINLGFNDNGIIKIKYIPKKDIKFY